MPDRLRVLICANPDLNYIDGSSVWSQTIALAMAGTDLTTVDFLARSRPGRDELFQALNQHADIRVIDGASELNAGIAVTRLRPEDMVTVAAKLDRQHQYDLVIVRGEAIALGVANIPSLYERCWIYLTDIAQRVHDYDRQKLQQMGRLANGCHRILCQSQGFIRLWKSLVPGISDDKFLLYTPVVPDPVSTVQPIAQRNETVIYAGKFAPDWMTIEMAECWTEIHKRHPLATLRMIGDKFHQDGSDFHVRMRSVLNESPGVDWLGAMSRDKVQKELMQARIGLSWRSDGLNDTLEYSTKILEYGSAGCAAVLNRNPLHEDLLGEDYPLFANSRSEFMEAVSLGLSDTGLTQLAACRIAQLASKHIFTTRVEQLKGWLSKIVRPAASVNEGSVCRLRVLVAGHDLKFVVPLMNKLKESGRFEFLIDQWRGHASHDEHKSLELLRQADVVWCEWCLGNLRWYSNNLLPNQRLVARFHAQENHLSYLEEADWNRISLICFVSEPMRYQSQVKSGFPSNKTTVIANYIDPDRFSNQAKVGGSEFMLGMIGWVPAMKRIDRSVDTLERLLDKDERYFLRIKGRHPFEYEWMMKRDDEVGYYRNLLRRINSHRLLSRHVIFDPPGDDIAQWLSLVQYILSPSDAESFHMAIGEGIMTGSHPVIWPWKGAAEIWGRTNIVEDADHAAAAILAGAFSPPRLPEHMDPQSVVDQWTNVLTSSG